jgi:hypothetical protein
VADAVQELPTDGGAEGATGEPQGEARPQGPPKRNWLAPDETVKAWRRRTDCERFRRQLEAARNAGLCSLSRKLLKGQIKEPALLMRAIGAIDEWREKLSPKPEKKPTPKVVKKSQAEQKLAEHGIDPSKFRVPQESKA